MSAKLLEGGPIADKIMADVAAAVAALPADQRPTLAAVMAGSNPGARAYAKMQAKAAEQAGIAYELIEFPEDVTQSDLVDKILELNHNPRVTGIIQLMPVPEGINARALQNLIDPLKDVDGVTPAALGEVVRGNMNAAPCTAQSVMELVKTSGLTLRGLECVMVGHSEIVGKPVALLLLEQLATVTVCHIGTSEAGMTESHTRGADLLIVAVGVKGLIKGDMIKPGAVVIDVGMNRVKDAEGKTRMVGDVVFEEAVEVASQITPVPGGVGPLTTAILVRNTLNAWKLQKGL
jgi:methylenetetrahydrofolate dehydrogenase (NADP+)/methenyltetrahydrofolate cyclohydrolase